MGRAGPDPVMRISTGVQGRTRHDLGGGRSRHCTPPLVLLWKWGCEMAQPQVNTRDMGRQKCELGRAYFHPRPFSHARAAPGPENRCPIFEGACPGFLDRIGVRTPLKKARAVISYPVLVKLHPLRINAFGSPYLERINPDVMRYCFCQHVLQCPVASPGLLKSTVAREKSLRPNVSVADSCS